MYGDMAMWLLSNLAKWTWLAAIFGNDRQGGNGQNLGWYYSQKCFFRHSLSMCEMWCLYQNSNQKMNCLTSGLLTWEWQHHMTNEHTLWKKQNRLQFSAPKRSISLPFARHCLSYFILPSLSLMCLCLSLFNVSLSLSLSLMCFCLSLFLADPLAAM